jgi:predicted  nucleic acid-binding Zn-ribbon protein
LARRVSELEIELDSVKSMYVERERHLDEVAQAVSVIEENLHSIQGKNKQVRLLEHTDVPDKQERIKKVLYEINNFMTDVRQRMAELEMKAQRNPRTAALENTIDNLRTSVKKIEGETNGLRATIAVLSTRVTDLNSNLSQKTIELERKSQELSQKQAELEERNRQLSTGFYVADNKDGLLQKGIIVRIGGFLGIGKTIRLADKLEKSDFRAINIRSVSTFELGTGRSALLVTSHPADSYRLEKMGDGTFRLTVVDANRFWSQSKFMVASID